MSSYHICTACRRRLAQVRPFKASQWTARATFISLSNSKPRTTTDEKVGEEGSTSRKDVESNIAKGKEKLNLFPRKQPRAADNPGDLLETLFQQTLTPPLPSADAETPQSTFSLDNYQNAETLKKMLAEPNGVGDAWYFFVAHFGPDAWTKSSAESRSMPSYLHMSAKNLLRQIIQAKARDPFSKTLPTVAEVSWIYAKLELLHGWDWTELVLILIENILKLKQQSVTDPAKEKRLLVDLLGAWNVICRKSGPPPLCPPPEDPTPLDWFNVPYFSSQDVIQTQRRLGALPSFAMLTPSFRTQHLNGVPLVATATTMLLQQNLEQNNENTIPTVEHLFNALNTFLKSSGYDVSQLWRSAQGPNIKSALDFVVKGWSASDEKTESKSEEGVSEASLPPAPEVPQHDPSVSRLRVGDIFKRLENAIAQRDAAHVDRLWSDAVKLPISHDTNEDGSSSLTADHRVRTLSAALCNHFITANMGLRKPSRAIDVWNHMVSNGLTPDVKTWNAMLTGCKVARDRNALESIWKKMLMAGVKPDAPCWTTRVSGLIECNLVNQGLHALNEMGRMWLAANPQKKGKKGQEIPASLKDAVKPTIETVNAAVSALLRKRKEEAAHRVLNWAGKLGLRPDTATFNILLRPLIREGRVEEVNSLLKQMQNTGIQADTVTFTIILDETLRTIGDEPPEQQIEIVNSVFSEMEKAGIESSQHTYGKIIYQLLQTPTGDMTAVNTVLDRMSQQGVQVSTHIYTMLMERYFSSQPPNLDAVRSLIEAAQYKIGGTDTIFWDRVIEGYSRAGETAAAMRILGKLEGEENQSSYYTLRTLLMALVQNQEWDFARTLVENTRSERGGPISRLERGREGQHQFWELAGELNLL